MADTATTTPDTAAAAADAPKTDAPKTFTQDQVNDLIAREKGQIQGKYADYDDLKSKAAEFDKAAEARKTEQQKLEERASTAETKLTATEAKVARYEAAAKAGLGLKHAGRIQGSTPEEMEADAKALAEELGKSGGTDFDGGARTTAPTGDMNAFIRDGSGRSKKTG